MSKARTGRPRKRRSVSTKAPPWAGDHGTGMRAAIEGTTIEPANEPGEPNPNNMGRRVRKDAYRAYSLTMKQQQAAKLIRDAYCRVDALSSGGGMKTGELNGQTFLLEQVQSSPKPDAAIDRQCAAMSHLIYVTKKSTRVDMKIFDHVLRENQHIAQMDRKNAHILIGLFKHALNRVALHMRY